MPLQYPDQSYYPSAKVRLIVRFDEFGDTKKVIPATPKKAITKLKGTKDPRSGVTAAIDPDAPQGVKRYILNPDASVTPGGPQKQDTSTDKLTHVIGGIIPSSMEIGLNGIRQADTLKVEFRYVDLPIDPRTVRSCAIEAYLGTVSGDDFVAGNSGGVRTSSRDKEPLNVVPDTYDGPNGKRTNLRFEGFVDEWEIEFDESNEPIVRMTCRDNTQLLIDTDAPPQLVLAMKDPIDKAVATYLSNFPIFAGMTVEYRPGSETPPMLDGRLGKTAYNPQTGGPSPAKGGGGSKLNTWDYLTDIIGAIGHQIRVEGTTIIIEQVRTVQGKKFTQRPDDPYQGREIGGVNYPARLMLWGRNLSSMKIARKYGKVAPKNIEVVSYHTGNKQQLVVRFPDPKDPLISKANPGGGNEAQYTVIKVHGVFDKNTLKVFAQTLYESIGRNELTVSLSTVNLASFGGGNADPDLLDMKAGDTIDVQVSREDEVFNNTPNKIENAMQLQSRAELFLTTVGYSPEFAAAAAKASSDAGFQTLFRVKGCTFKWETDRGVSIDIHAVNYIEVRADKILPKDVAP